jgi:hypothetical protein
MAELSLSDYGRAANDVIAAWKRDMEKPRRKLGEACNELAKLEKKKTLTDDEKKRLKECNQVRDSIRSFIIAESKKLDSRLQSFKLKEDTDPGAFGKVQGKLGTLVKDGLPLSEHFSITLKPLKLNGGLFMVKGRF